MKTREETALEFCGLVTLPHGVRVPEADAPLPDALAFVGHVAEAMPEGVVLHDIRRVYVGWDAWGWRVVFYAADDRAAEAPDLSQAAMLAAISAKRGAL